MATTVTPSCANRPIEASSSADLLEPDRLRHQLARAAAATRGDRAQHPVVVAHRHPVHAEDAQLVRDHARHRHRRRARVAEQEPDLDVAAAAAQAADRVRARLPAGRARRSRRARRRRSARGSPRRAPRRRRARRRARAPAASFARVDVDRDHPRAGRRGDHHRGEADAAAAVHGDPLARAHLRRARAAPPTPS